MTSKLTQSECVHMVQLGMTPEEIRDEVGYRNTKPVLKMMRKAGLITNRGYTYRMYPTRSQEQVLWAWFGQSRFVYNHAIREWEDQYKESKTNISRTELFKSILNLKQTPEYEWLNEIPGKAIQAELDHFDIARRRYFDSRAKGILTKRGRKKKKEGKPITKRDYAGYPNIKRRYDSRKSFTISNTETLKHLVDWDSGVVRVPKLGDVRCKLHRRFEGVAKNITISKTATGKHYISFSVESLEPLPPKLPFDEHSVVGIDMGTRKYGTLSDPVASLPESTIIQNPRWLEKNLSKLARMNRQQSRAIEKWKAKTESSEGWAKQKARWADKLRPHEKLSRNRPPYHSYKKRQHEIAKLHEKIVNQRKDYQCQTVAKIFKEYNAICRETLNIKGMLQNKKIARHIQGAAWGQFGLKMDSYARYNGKTVLKIDMFAPSSKLCSICGYHNGDLGSGEFWTCPQCGTYHDRDVNAAANIKQMALADLSS